MKVLVINDDPKRLELLILQLVPTFDNICVANTVQEALTKIDFEMPAIILFDLVNPDGYIVHALALIREECNIPILILSPINNPELIAQALDMGADDYLIKPVHRDVLLANINKLLRRRKTSQNIITIPCNL